MKLPNLKGISINFSTEDSPLSKEDQSIHDKKVLERILSHAKNTDSIINIRMNHISIYSLDSIISALPLGLKNVKTVGMVFNNEQIGRLNEMPLSGTSFIRLLDILATYPNIRKVLVTSMYMNPITVKIKESDAITLARSKNIDMETLYNFVESCNINFIGDSDLRTF